MRKKRTPKAVEVTDPLLIEALQFYRSADARTKAAMMRLMERMAVEKMPTDLAAGLFRLECDGADPAYIAAWRRQQVGIAS